MTSVRIDGTIEFRFFRPDALSVGVAGDFNGWRGAALEMEREGSGWWFVAARLPAGDYRFRYLVDGRWFTDFAANGVELDKMGWNSVLVVPQVMKNIKNKFAA